MKLKRRAYFSLHLFFYSSYFSASHTETCGRRKALWNIKEKQTIATSAQAYVDESLRYEGILCVYVCSIFLRHDGSDSTHKTLFI